MIRLTYDSLSNSKRVARQSVVAEEKKLLHWVLIASFIVSNIAFPISKKSVYTNAYTEAPKMCKKKKKVKRSKLYG